MQVDVIQSMDYLIMDEMIRKLEHIRGTRCRPAKTSVTLKEQPHAQHLLAQHSNLLAAISITAFICAHIISTGRTGELTARMWSSLHVLRETRRVSA
jgi:hypothetical protein